MTGRGGRPYALSIATTALFVEILIVGLQVEVAVLALAYVLGIVADRLADTIIDRFERTRPGRLIKAWFSKSRGTVEDSAISKMRIRGMHESEPTPLTRYRYPGTRVGEGESVVTAYLLAVERERRPSRRERWRNPAWVHRDEAVRLLGDSREPRYAEEHERVVREAVAALTRSPS